MIKRLVEEMSKLLEISEVSNKGRESIATLIDYIKQEGKIEGSNYSIKIKDFPATFNKEDVDESHIINGKITLEDTSCGIHIHSQADGQVFIEATNTYNKYITLKNPTLDEIFDAIIKAGNNYIDVIKAKETRIKENALTKDIFNDLADKGFKCILEFTKVYDIQCDGTDEDGYPDCSYEYQDSEVDYVAKIGKYGISLEDDKICLGSSQDRESWDYPSGGTPDNITYTSCESEYRTEYYFINEYNEKLQKDAITYILETYPNSKLAEYIKEINLANIDMDEYKDILIDYLTDKDFD